MAYQSRDLSVLAYANGFTLWHYTTKDAAVTGTNYFNQAADMLRSGDLLVVTSTNTTTPSSRMLVVTAASPSSVAVGALS